MNMTKKVIRLTESDLHNMVKDSVKRILKEGYSKDKPITYDLGNGGEDKYQTLRYNGEAVGTIDHTHKTVSPMHGYFYPNPVSKGLMRYAKKLGYEYVFDDNWEKEKNSKKKSLMEGWNPKPAYALEDEASGAVHMYYAEEDLEEAIEDAKKKRIHGGCYVVRDCRDDSIVFSTDPDVTYKI